VSERRIVAIIPVGWLDGAKSRLGGALDAEERRDLVIRMLGRTVAAAIATPDLADTVVISPDREALDVASAAGARTMRQRTQGLNAGLVEARDDAVAGGASAVLILPIDLPLVSPAALGELIAAASVPGPVVALVSDRHGRGTNALLLAPPDAIAPAFGGDSRSAHVAAAAEAGARFIAVESPLAVDLDTPDDLLLLEDVAPDAVHVH
jgi:2-phospho-L-lactate guanylyltransferase